MVDLYTLKIASEKVELIQDTLSKIDEVVTALAAFGDVTGIQDSINTINTKLSTVADNANNYVHPATHPVSIINGVGYPSKFVKTDASGNTGFDVVLWTDLQNKPSSFTPAAHEHDLSEITSGNLDASRVAESSLRQFVTALQKAQFLTMESTDNKGQAGGYAPLGSDGKIPSSYMGQLDVLDVYEASNEVTMLALTAGRGDLCIRSDYPSTSSYPTYILKQLPASTLANWVGINSSVGVSAVNGKVGVVNLGSDDIGEGVSNLYFTTPRVVTAVRNLLASGTNNVSLTYNSVSGTLSISVDGYTKSEVAALIANAEDTLGTSIASAATITIGTAGMGDTIHITGAVPISSLGTAVQAGIRRLLIFDSATTLTHSSSLICPNATSIITVAGMAIEVIAESTSVWRVVKVQHPSVTVAQIGFLAGVTSDVQTQINSRVAKVATTDNCIMRADGTGGAVQASLAYVDDSGNVGISIEPKAKLNVYTVNPTGGNPIGSGSAADPAVMARFGAGSVCMDFGVQANGVQWIQCRGIGDYSIKYDLQLQPSGGNAIFGGNPAPILDNTKSNGLPTARWSTIYAGTGTINTSDEREKTFYTTTDVEKQVASELKTIIKKFRFNNAITAKGEDNARLHFGVGAQTVVSIFAKYGLDANKYALLCYDEWDAEYEKVEAEDGEIEETIEVQKTQTVQKTKQEIKSIDGTPTLVETTEEVEELVYEEKQVVDANGTLLTHADGTPILYKVPVMQSVTKKYKNIVKREAGNRYGIRYEELAMFILGAE